MTPDKICHECDRDLLCVRTGATVYLAHTGDTHTADMFACFNCNIFRIFGLNMIPLKIWDDDRKPLTPIPDVVVAGKIIVIPYSNESTFATLEGEVIPLPAALQYMIEQCWHETEIRRYLTNVDRHAKASRWIK